MRQTKFMIDFLGSKEFEGYTLEETWNGFACPYFTFEEAQKVVDAWGESGSIASYDSNSDKFNFEMQDGETDSFPAIQFDGMKLYPIGNGCWIWSEADSAK
jgi:hypothetical protein